MPNPIAATADTTAVASVQPGVPIESNTGGVPQLSHAPETGTEGEICVRASSRLPVGDLQAWSPSWRACLPRSGGGKSGAPSQCGPSTRSVLDQADPDSTVLQCLQRLDRCPPVLDVAVRQPCVDRSRGLGVEVATCRGPEHLAAPLRPRVHGDKGPAGERAGPEANGLATPGGAVEQRVEPGDREGAARYVVDDRFVRLTRRR